MLYCSVMSSRSRTFTPTRGAYCQKTNCLSLGMRKLSFYRVGLKIFFVPLSVIFYIIFVLCGTKKACHLHLLMGMLCPIQHRTCYHVCSYAHIENYQPRPNGSLLLLLLLSGDVSLSPGPTNSSHIRMATINAG